MAFRELVEGECGGSNSLIRLASHYVQDHGFKEEGIRRPFSSSEAFPTPDADQLVQQFLEEPACPQTFRMDNLMQEMREIDQNIHPPKAGPEIITELKNDLDKAWDSCLRPPNEFRAKDDTWNASAVLPVQGEGQHLDNVHEFGLDPKWAEDFLECNTDSVQDKNDINQTEDEDPNFAYSKFMKFMERQGDIPIESNQTAINLRGTSEEWTEQFIENNAGSLNDNTVLNKVEEELEAAGTWIDEFAKENPTTEDNMKSLWKRFEDEWDKISADGISSMHPWVSEFDTYYDPFNKEYDFSETNPMKDLPNALAEGKRRLEAGDLPSAVLCFEAAAQQDENNIEAWLLLGKTQAENEQDPLAISALNRCLCLDPSNSVALMALAASYANESYQKQACLTLKEWLLKNEKYKHLAGPESNLKKDEHPNFSVSTLLYDKVYDEVKDLYIEAARMNPRDEIDADVQCGLGILFNLSNDYNKAVDCFQAALHVRPDDSRLWNRLGATLANGQRSAEAVNAYHRALELSPGFIRARYNLGISCVNLASYKEAGEHLLIALNQQAAGRGPQASNAPPKTMSNTIWSTLRLVISLMHKYELMEAIENRDLPRLNKEFEIM
ncbi:PREDICTED: peroxisomal targeting signal 1 receptor [Wasmannia auropunctata]|uniref:peroxisomal targeting signal 1 receptor n=1 Tax=Wasmannia auropunctata TaxID=64793 RepID=UPI0005EFD59B|nr:PREDICTED: peroxisomal targeting signal 1 receptor [Wasmannia auropunctata]XP_011690627.1 PREDICTED: peroxisomal targeting signal 1 receptor [Wasmannia auropunctata]XP_011690628.1 PREDICTED: peroxisomal targeting signal 1 receptor [Wasmannia auropunctata]